MLAASHDRRRSNCTLHVSTSEPSELINLVEPSELLNLVVLLLFLLRLGLHFFT